MRTDKCYCRIFFEEDAALEYAEFLTKHLPMLEQRKSALITRLMSQ